MIISVSSWSFHQELYAGTLRLSDVPYHAFDLGYRAVELNDMFLYPRPPNRIARLLGRKAKPFVRKEYDIHALRAVRLNRFRSGTKLVCWTIDSDLTLQTAAREAQLAYLAQAIQAARFLGAPMIRVTLGGETNDRSALDRAVNLMSSVLPVAIAANIKLAVENHGGLSNDPDLLIEFIERCRGGRSSALGACLDLGNFERDPLIGIQKIAPYAIHVHAKALAFDDSGEEATIDYKSSLSILKAAGYAGALSIEYEGQGGAAEGIHQTRDLIEKYW
ncbi:MAG TPA: sugar phosphate isomerase/epimerase [Anaerolineae bacterium]|nr:sugar phosphate isomerase/epimerase [Anaerolineae bacterium]